MAEVSSRVSDSDISPISCNLLMVDTYFHLGHFLSSSSWYHSPSLPQLNNPPSSSVYPVLISICPRLALFHGLLLLLLIFYTSVESFVISSLSLFLSLQSINSRLHMLQSVPPSNRNKFSPNRQRYERAQKSNSRITRITSGGHSSSFASKGGRIAKE